MPSYQATKVNLFWKKFLREAPGIFSRQPKQRVQLAAFGKHPAWDDHIDDIGLESESLLLAKQVLYVDGVGGQINLGEWENLPPGQSLAQFQHVFVWKRGEAFLLGKIGASRDGKNRSKYPLVLTVHCQGIPFFWALEHLLPVLDNAEGQCKEAVSAEEVRYLLKMTSEVLNRLVAQPLVKEQDQVSGDNLLERLQLNQDEEAAGRIIYALKTSLSRYLASAKREDVENLRPGQIRLPAIGSLAALSLSFWTQVLESQLGKDVPLLLTLPMHESWLDATVGEPSAREFFCLRAGTSALPPVHEVPYTVDETFRKDNQALLMALLQSKDGFVPPVEAGNGVKKWF